MFELRQPQLLRSSVAGSTVYSITHPLLASPSSTLKPCWPVSFSSSGRTFLFMGIIKGTWCFRICCYSFELPVSASSSACRTEARRQCPCSYCRRVERKHRAGYGLQIRRKCQINLGQAINNSRKTGEGWPGLWQGPHLCLGCQGHAIGHSLVIALRPSIPEKTSLTCLHMS